MTVTSIVLGPCTSTSRSASSRSMKLRTRCRQGLLPCVAKALKMGYAIVITLPRRTAPANALGCGSGGV
jgi:hypothetical protein